MARAAVKRVQAIFTPDQYALLEEYARETGRSLSAVVRDSVAAHLLADLVKARKRKALQRILELPEAPVKDWPEMERELDATRYACDDDIPLQ